MDSQTDSRINVFAYGSNMCTQRICQRVASATPLATGYVTHRRLTFRKRSKDGSAKADAAYTGCAQDCVWGVVFSLKNEDKPVLDDYEPGYAEEEIVVIGDTAEHPASIYVARAEAIDASLKPYSWYLRLVIHGAVQHGLPIDYFQELRSFGSMEDPDSDRDRRNSRIIRG